MNDKNLGMKIWIRFADDSIYSSSETTIRNITEVHYNYPSALSEKRIAFESDIHSTGFTYNVSDIAEFETSPETEVSDAT